jgi:glycosyltransferase involved in cell wall biosynthesis
MKKTVTIGIPAYNEEKNIRSLLMSLVLQKGNNFILEKIIVACDGCTDSTANIVSQLSKKYSKIYLINDGKRLGKNVRLNNFYKHLKSSIFIAIDADVRIKSNRVISEIVQAFNDENVMLAGGQVIPLPPKTFIGRAIATQEYFWSHVKTNINNGNNVHTHTGPFSAAGKQFIKKIKIPLNIPDDHFLYFKTIQKGYQYRYVKHAKVYIEIPQNFNDYMHQSTRFLTSADNVKTYFGDFTEQYYHVSRFTKIKSYIITFIKYPFHLPIALILVGLQKVFASLYMEKKGYGLWTQIKTSK